MAKIVLLFTIVFAACVLGYKLDKTGRRHEGDSAAYGKPVSGEMPAEGEHEAKPLNMIGKCSTKRFVGSSQRCIRKFFMVFRRDKNADCYKHFDRIEGCVNKRIYNCLKGTTLESRIKEMQQTFTDALTGKKHGFNVREIYCGNKPIKLPKLPADATECSRKLWRFMRKDMFAFYRAFRRNKADRSLCKSYADLVSKILRKANESCGQEVKDLKWLSGIKFNPFCSKRQYHRH